MVPRGDVGMPRGIAHSKTWETWQGRTLGNVRPKALRQILLRAALGRLSGKLLVDSGMQEIADRTLKRVAIDKYGKAKS